MKLIRPQRADFHPNVAILRRTLVLGMTSFLSQISLVAAMAAINNMLRKYGAQDATFGQVRYAQIPMAVVGIVMKFFQIVLLSAWPPDAFPLSGIIWGPSSRSGSGSC